MPRKQTKLPTAAPAGLRNPIQRTTPPTTQGEDAVRLNPDERRHITIDEDEVIWDWFLAEAKRRGYRNSRSQVIFQLGRDAMRAQQAADSPHTPTS